MKKKNKKKLQNKPYISKFFILFFIFLVFIFFSNNTHVSQKLYPRGNYYEKINNLEVEKSIKQIPTQPPFNWSVEKVDENITKVSLPPDPRMTTEEELFNAMNEYRKAHKVQILTRSDLLCSIAQKRAEEQLVNGELDGHVGFDKYAKEQNEFNRMGEVLFGGAQPQFGVHIVEFGWNRSLTGHKEAIQDPAWSHGCGGVSGYFAVFIFGTR